MANSIDERIPTEDNNGNTMHETNAQSLGKSMEYYSLLKGKGSERHGDTARKRLDRDISHAPLLSGDIIDMYASNPDSAHELVPQYGLLGCKEDEDPTLPSSQVFLNTNAPFSTFVCGVQGSGKSHTTACMIENAVVPSKTLGELKKPMSALVFSYGEWSNGGANFTLSEAISLATPAAGFPHLKAKKITVLVSPTNPAIKTLYERYDVQVIPFMLKPSSLDISALRALMAVDETSAVPLYMAKIESILRDIAMKSKDGVVDYSEFKKAVDKQGFDAHQENMLNMHLNLLETFLDQKGELPEPSYGAGEIVIIDLSDQFLTPSTACVLFKLGLEQFLKCSKVKGKLVVLDEAHKVSELHYTQISLLIGMIPVYARQSGL